MAMSQIVLATELTNLNPVATEAAARITLANAYAEFASDAVAGATQITLAGVTLGKNAMLSALVGMNAPGAGAAVIKNAIQAFWGAVALGLATSFPSATAITAPPHTSLNLTSVFASNTSSSASKATAVANIASALYAQAIVGGTVTFPGPVVSPIL